MVELLAAGPAPDLTTSGAGSVTGLVFFALVAIGFSFFCSIAEAVLLSVSPSYIATLSEKRPRAARSLEALKANIDRPLAAILSLNTIAHTVGAAGVGAQAAGIWGHQAVGWASAAMTLLILVLSEIIPKTVGAVYWRSLAPWIARLVRWLIWLLLPLVWMSELLTRLIAHKEHVVVTREEVVAMAELSVEGGQLAQGESRILKNLFRLRSLTAEDVMTPRTVILAFSQDRMVGDVLAERSELPVSRIPIYDGRLDHITGFVLKADILLQQAQDKPSTKLLDLKRPLKRVPVTATLSQVFDELLNDRQHIALVVDEYGGTDGLVTLEDVLETLLGAEIVDEADAVADLRHHARRQWARRAEALGLNIEGAPTPDEQSPDEPPATG